MTVVEGNSGSTSNSYTILYNEKYRVEFTVTSHEGQCGANWALVLMKSAYITKIQQQNAQIQPNMANASKEATALNTYCVKFGNLKGYDTK